MILLTRCCRGVFESIMGPLKAAAAHGSGERICHGLGEDLETHGVASAAGELDNWLRHCR